MKCFGRGCMFCRGRRTGTRAEFGAHSLARSFEKCNRWSELEPPRRSYSLDTPFAGPTRRAAPFVFGDGGEARRSQYAHSGSLFSRSAHYPEQQYHPSFRPQWMRMFAIGRATKGRNLLRPTPSHLDASRSLLPLPLSLSLCDRLLRRDQFRRPLRCLN